MRDESGLYVLGGLNGYLTTYRSDMKTPEAYKIKH